MAVLAAPSDFTSGQQVTHTNLNAHVNSATFAAGAVDNSTTQLSGGSIIVKDGGVTAAKLASNAVTTAKILDGNVTSAKLDTDIAVSGTFSAGGTSTLAAVTATSFTNTGISKEGGLVRCTADFTKNADVSLATVTGMSLTVEAGKKYAIDATLLVDYSTGGVKADFGGTATATSLIAEGVFIANVGLVGQARITAINSVFVNAVPGAGSQGQVNIRGYIQVNAGGTFLIRFAQSSSSGTDSTVKAGSWMRLTECGN